jgi:poly(A) polymerase
LFPATAASLERDTDGRFRKLIEKALENTDLRVAEERPVTPMFLFAVLLWQPVRELAAEIAAAEDCTEQQALMTAAAEISAEQTRRIALPRRFSLPMREVLQLQARLENRGGKRARALPQHKRFRAAYDLLVLRAAVGDADPDTADFWTAMQQETGEAEPAPVPTKRRRRRRRAPRRSGPAVPAP